MHLLLRITTITATAIAAFCPAVTQAQPFDVPTDGQSEALTPDLEFAAPTAMAFDSKNRPYVMNHRNPDDFGTIRTLRDDQWFSVTPEPIREAGISIDRRDLQARGQLVLDDDDAIYATIGSQLLYSPDLGRTFKSYRTDGSLELRVGHNVLSAPPAICLTENMRYVDRGPVRKNEMAWWAKRGTLSVLLPRKDGDELILGEPILISENCMAAGSAGHSGGTSFAVTTGRYTHVVYAETPEDLRYGGNPIHIATIDRETREVIAREFLVNASPRKADVHTRPTITVDSRGYLHVLSGAHGQPFFYVRSEEPDSITDGWTKPQELSGRQSYASIVCDGMDRLHSVFRDWIPHPALGYATASAQRWDWSRSETLVHGANPKGVKEYGIFYHRLFIDRASNLYLNFTFYEFKTKQSGDYPEVLMVSKDGGKTWQLADTDSFSAEFED